MMFCRLPVYLLILIFYSNSLAVNAPKSGGVLAKTVRVNECLDIEIIQRIDSLSTLPFIQRTKLLHAGNSNAGGCESSRLYHFKLANGVLEDWAVKQIMATGVFEYVEFDALITGAAEMRESLTPNDNFLFRQWYVYNDGTFPNGLATSGADMDLLNAWSITTGSADVLVAFLDSGISLDQNEFEDRIWQNEAEQVDGTDADNNGYIDDFQGWNFVDNNNDVADDNGHGTIVTGVVGANGNNGIGYAGIDWHCKLMICKVLDSDLSGFYSDWIEGIYYAVNNGARIINMSFGGASYSQALQEAVDYAHSRNVTLVSSMQNDNAETKYYPAAFSKVIAVGASDPDDHRSTSFVSNTTQGSNFGNHIDVIAPGNYIHGLSLSNNVYTKVIGGTSLASPMVTGIAALLLADNPEYSNEEIYARITGGSQDEVGNPVEDTPGWDKYYGYGRVNAYQALTLDPEEQPKGPLVFPNPFHEVTNISYTLEGSADLELDLINIQGKVLFREVYPDVRVFNTQLQLSHINSGNYILRFVSPFGTYTRRLLIIKE